MNICNGCGMPIEDAYSSGHLVLSHFGTCKSSHVETNLSWTCLVSGLLSFEHPSVLLFVLAEIYVPRYTAVSATERSYNTKGKTMFAFSVKGCREAHITLLHDNRRIYDIGLGKDGNAKSTLSRIGHYGWAVYRKPTLDCMKFMPFYVTWNNGEVKVGKGLTIGKNEILSLEDNQIPSIDDVRIEAGSADLTYIIE